MTLLDELLIRAVRALEHDVARFVAALLLALALLGLLLAARALR